MAKSHQNKNTQNDMIKISWRGKPTERQIQLKAFEITRRASSAGDTLVARIQKVGLISARIDSFTADAADALRSHFGVQSQVAS